MQASIRAYEIPLGGMWEDSSFHIALDYEVWADPEFTPCPHCHSPTRKTIGVAPHLYIENYVTCPRVIVAQNEGGHCSTGVCLDCVLEAGTDLTRFPLGELL